MALPPEFKMGLDVLAQNCGWTVRRFAGASYVRTEESYLRHSDPGLLTFKDLIGPGPQRAENPDGFAALSSAASQDDLLDDGLNPLIAQEMQRHQERGTLGAAVAAFQLMYTTCSSSVLPDQVREMRDKIVPAVDEQSSLHVIMLTPRLNWRAAAMRTLLAADVTPGSVSQAGVFKGFQTGTGLFAAMTYGAVPYLAPALLTAAPYVNGVQTSRAGQNLVWMFDRPLVGRGRPTDDLIEALSDSQGRFHPRDSRPKAAYDRPSYQRQESLLLLRWWIRRVNLMLASATDIGRFADGAGDYQPRRHFAFLLSLERLFTGLHQTLSEAGRNESLRLTSAYDALDCLDGMGMGLGDFAAMTTPSKARAALDRLRVDLPADFAAVVLPRCESAVEALEGVKDGFFLPGVATPQGLLGLPGNEKQALGWDKAIPAYLRIDRNSAHSFVNELDPVAEPNKFTIFAAHDGRLSPHLADLAFLWVLRVLSDPSLLFKAIDRKPKKKRRRQ